MAPSLQSWEKAPVFRRSEVWRQQPERQFYSGRKRQTSWGWSILTSPFEQSQSLSTRGGGRWIGPAVPLSGNRIVLAAVSDRRRPHASPRPWVPSPFFQILDLDGRVVGKGGRIEDQGGRFLSWLGARAVLGVQGDTIRVFSLLDAVLTTYIRKNGSENFLSSRSTQFPVYFRNPEIVEDVVSFPWVSVGGEHARHNAVSQVETAAFAGRRLYSIRNYRAEWIEDRNRHFSLDGAWEVTRQGLEIYDLEGNLLSRHGLPIRELDWIRADPFGRVFLGTTDSVIVVNDPSWVGPRCPPLPRRVVINQPDPPPTRHPHGLEVWSQGVQRKEQDE